ncbi:MAG TPA: polyprenol monophosphomannose synthase [Candidatus Limnocylindrales bacterium]|nr:polyprenol monophosphomannose synthase [Candidatus Limnocylindrales bacterium]
MTDSPPADRPLATLPEADAARTAGPYADTWVVLPTFNEAENLEPIAAAILEQLPGATLLVVDDASPDGTGDLADALAAREPRVRVLHRPGKQGLGRAYVDGFRVALDGGAERIVQMDADWSHDPAYLPAMVDALVGGESAPDPAGADLVIGSRYARGGGVRDWGFGRRVVSRGGSIFARTVLGLTPHDLTGGFKAWRRTTLAAIPWPRLHSGGYVFQIEMTYLASRAGARVVEVPIVFSDRRVGVSKMSRRIIFEALLVVLRLRWEELRRRRLRRPTPGGSNAGSGATGTGD